MHGAKAAEDSDLWANYDPNAASVAWRASAGAMRSTELNELLRALKGEREQEGATEILR